MPVKHQSSIQSFLNHLSYQKRYSPHTITAYENDLTGFFDYIEMQFGPTPLAGINPSFVRSWLASLKQADMQSKSLNRKISSLKSFFKYQLREGTVPASPMAAIISPKARKRLPQFVAEKDLDDLFDHVAFPDDWEGRTDRLILALFYNTGMRQAELVNLATRQVDVSNCQIKLLGKGNKERIVPVSTALMRQLREYINDKSSRFSEATGGRLLVNAKGRPLYPKYVYKSVRKYLSLVTTIDKRSPHILRHSFATHLVNNGAELNAVKELLGHSSLAATQVYTHNTIEKLKKVFEQAHPKA
jgi:integrase/recombinase XerC